MFAIAIILLSQCAWLVVWRYRSRNKAVGQRQDSL